MDQDLNKLAMCDIFDGLSRHELKHVLNQISYNIKTFSQGQVIFSQHHLSQNLGILIKGRIKVAKFLPSGKSIIIARFIQPASFGEGTVFSSEDLNPSTVIADCPTRVLFIDRNNLLTLFFLNQQIMNNFLKLLSQRLLLLNQKISLLSLSSIREKISYYLLDQAAKQNAYTIKLPYTKTYLANYLCVPRPSLSREISKMQKDGLIQTEGRTIMITDMNSLEELLL